MQPTRRRSGTPADSGLAADLLSPRCIPEGAPCCASRHAIVAIAGPGKLSVEGALGIRLPVWLFPAGVAGAVATVEYAMRASAGQEQVPAEEAGGELQAQEQATHEA
jgi:hypothetical protein